MRLEKGSENLKGVKIDAASSDTPSAGKGYGKGRKIWTVSFSREGALLGLRPAEKGCSAECGYLTEGTGEETILEVKRWIRSKYSSPPTKKVSLWPAPAIS